jgi:aspartate-semialdehyde dehydrogenase
MAAAASRELKIAVIGATGAVGSQIIELLEGRAVPCAEVGLFATERGAAQRIEAFSRRHQVVELREPADLARFDVALLAVPPSVAADIIRDRPGPSLVDLSAAIRAPSAVVPLIAPGFTKPERTAELAARGKTVAIAHPAAHVLAMIIEAGGMRNAAVCATLMLGASAEGRHNVEEVAREAGALLSGAHSLEEGETQRAFNAYPAEAADDLTAAICGQVGALMGSAPRLTVEAVNAAILHGSAMTVLIPDPPAPADLIARLRSAPGLLLIEGEEEGASVIDAIGQEAVMVRVRTQATGASLWCAFDNVRLAALDAVWVVEKLASSEPAGAA